MSRARVVHLITGLTVGGAEMMLCKLVAGMDGERFENVVVTLWAGGELEAEIRAAGVRVRSLGVKRGRVDPRGLAALVGLLRRERPAVLQTWMYHANLLGSLAARPAGVRRLVWNVRTSDFVGRDTSRQTRWVDAACGVLSSTPLGPEVAVANARTGVTAHASRGYAPRRWEVIPNGFDTERFRPDGAVREAVRAELGLEAETPLVGHLARLDPMKGHDTLLRAAVLVRERFPDARFVLAGRGVETLRGADGGAPEGVYLLGERTDTPRLLAALDVFVSSSVYGEGFSNVIGEAMACGVPCVVTDVGDAAAIVGETGTVVPPGDAEALADATGHLLERSGEERRALGTAARERVRARYGLGAVVERYEMLYESLIAT